MFHLKGPKHVVVNEIVMDKKHFSCDWRHVYRNYSTLLQDGNLNSEHHRSLTRILQSFTVVLCFEMYLVSHQHVDLILPKKNWTPWPESASELYRPSDRRLSAKLVSTSAVRGCHVVSVTDSYGRILGYLDRPYFTKLSIIIGQQDYNSKL
jgi:hypothetical protein